MAWQFDSGKDDRDAGSGTLLGIDAQIAAMRRRALAAGQPDIEDVIEGGPIRLSRAARRCWAGERAMFLTNMEFSLLLALVENQGRVLSALQAARFSTGRRIAWAGAAQTGKVYIRRRRQKLTEAGISPSLILNVRGRGYIFDPGSTEPIRAAL